MPIPSPQLTTSTEELKNVRDYWVRALLERAKYELVHQMFGSTEYVPAGADYDGTNAAVKWMRVEPITIHADHLTSSTLTQAAISGVAYTVHDTGQGGYKLTQGNDPTDSGTTGVSKKLSITTVTATPDEYGAYYIGSKRLKRSGFHNVREMVTDVLGQNMGEVIDYVARNQLYNNLTTQYAGTATTIGTVAPGHLITFAELVEAVKTLKNNKAGYKKNKRFVAIISPETWQTFMLDRQFQEHVIYGGKTTMFDGMINKGRIEWVGVEFYESPIAFRQAGTLATVHSTMIFGDEVYGVLKLKDMGADNIFHDVGSAGTNDPMNQRWTQGWTANNVTKVLNSTWGVEIRHAVAA